MAAIFFGYICWIGLKFAWAVVFDTDMREHKWD